MGLDRAGGLSNSDAHNRRRRSVKCPNRRQLIVEPAQAHNVSISKEKVLFPGLVRACL